MGIDGEMVGRNWWAGTSTTPGMNSGYNPIQYLPFPLPFSSPAPPLSTWPPPLPPTLHHLPSIFPPSGLLSTSVFHFFVSSTRLPFHLVTTSSPQPLHVPAFLHQQEVQSQAFCLLVIYFVISPNVWSARSRSECVLQGGGTEGHQKKKKKKSQWVEERRAPWTGW